MKRSRKKIAEVEELILLGKGKGYLTCDEVKEHLPSGNFSRDQMDDVMSMFGDMDIEIIDSTKKITCQKQKQTNTPEEDLKDKEKEDEERETPTIGGTSDPVHIYFREMGKVSLLTREGEVEIAKRIESGEMRVWEEALSTPPAIQESLLLAERIRSGQVHVKDVLKSFHKEVDNEEEAEEEKLYQKKMLTSLEEVTRLHHENLKLRASLKKQKLSEVQHKVRKTKIAKNSSRITELLMKTPFQASQVDRIVQRIKAHLLRIEKDERALVKVRRETGFPVERLKRDYLLVLANPKEKLRAVKRLKMMFQDLSEIARFVLDVERNIKRIETEAQMSSVI